jgi:hypothetical protein
MTRDEKQNVLWNWIRNVFGDGALGTEERIARLLEEVIELAQAENFAVEKITQLVEYVYSRPPGEPFQEVGGISVTLLAYCQATGISADEAENTELKRIYSHTREHFRERQNKKAEVGISVKVT